MTTTINGFMGQSLPDKNLNRLSLVGASKAEMQAWVAALPVMNVGETAKRLYQTLQEITRLQTNEELRFDLLEILRQPVHTILQSLGKHYLNQSVLLPERASRVAALAQALRSHLALGYRIVVHECVDRLQTKMSMIGFGRRQTLQLTAQSLQRAITELGGLLLESSALYLPAPAGVWQDLHSLYRIATTYGLAQTKVQDNHYLHVREFTSSDAYLRTLILAASHTNKLRQLEIRQIYEASELWVAHLRLKAQADTSDLLVIDQDSDQPPAYIAKGSSENGPHTLFVDANKLVQHLQLLSSTPPAQIGKAESGLSASLLQHLINVWSAPTERTFARRSYQGELLVSLGLTATHYHLAGCLDFDTVINARQMLTEEESNFFLQRYNDSLQHKDSKEFDPWRLDFGHRDDDLHPEQQALLQYNNLLGDAKPQTTKTPEHHDPLRAQIINISPGGYCIRWQGEPPLNLRTGEILALREMDDKNWNIGVIRWVKQVPNEGAEAGVEILSARAKPCGAKVIKKTGETTEYMRALLLPEMKSLHRPATLITPNLTFKSGYRIVMRLGDEEVKAQLTTENLTTQSFSQFEFALLQSTEKNQTLGLMAAPTANAVSAGGDDFDSLWTNL